MNNKNKFDENKFQAILQLAEFGVKRSEERRSIEFRIFISYTTLLVLALYQLIKQQNPTSVFLQLIIQKEPISLELREGIVLYALALLLHTIYVMWQVGIGIAMKNDAYRRNFYLKKAEKMSGHPLEYEDKNSNSDRKIIIIEHYLQQFLHLKVIFTDWSRILLVAIPTILFIIVVDLFIKETNWKENTGLRVIPILTFVVIPAIVTVVSWSIIRFMKWRMHKEILHD